MTYRSYDDYQPEGPDPRETETLCSRCSPGVWTQTPQGCSCPSCPTWCGCECQHKQTGEDAAIEEQEYDERTELIEQQAQKHGASPAPEGD